MLEWEIVSGEQTQLEIIAALQGTELGQQYYKDLCERQQTLQRLVSIIIQQNATIKLHPADFVLPGYVTTVTCYNAIW